MMEHFTGIFWKKIKIMRIIFKYDIILIKTIIYLLNRFQTPYFWPSNCWEPENTDYAVYLCKRTMQNKTRLELADYEAENLARLQKMFSRKWEFIFMQVTKLPPHTINFNNNNIYEFF